jgi:hypothetical protein
MQTPCQGRQSSVPQLGRIAFITTPEYRTQAPDKIGTFVYRHLYSLSHSFEVLTTGRTYDFVMKLVQDPNASEQWPLIAQDTQFPINSPQDLTPWRRTIVAGLKRQGDGIEGMIEIAYELVGQRLDAVVHLTERPCEN